MPMKMPFAPDSLPERECCSHRRGRIEAKIIAGKGATVIVDHNRQPWSSGLPILTKQKNWKLGMVCLPDGICSWCLASVNKIEAFAIGFAPPVGQSQKAAGHLTNQVIDSTVAGKSLTCSLSELTHLPANRADWQRKSLKSQPLNRCLDLRRHYPPGALIVSRFAGKSCQSELSVLRYPSLSGPKTNVRVAGDQRQRSLSFQIWLDHPVTSHSGASSCFGHSAQLSHARTLRQIILKATRRAMTWTLSFFAPIPHRTPHHLPTSSTRSVVGTLSTSEDTYSLRGRTSYRLFTKRTCADFSSVCGKFIPAFRSSVRSESGIPGGK